MCICHTIMGVLATAVIGTIVVGIVLAIREGLRKDHREQMEEIDRNLDDLYIKAKIDLAKKENNDGRD